MTSLVGVTTTWFHDITPFIFSSTPYNLLCLYSGWGDSLLLCVSITSSSRHVSSHCCFRNRPVLGQRVRERDALTLCHTIPYMLLPWYRTLLYNTFPRWMLYFKGFNQTVLTGLLIVCDWLFGEKKCCMIVKKSWMHELISIKCNLCAITKKKFPNENKWLTEARLSSVFQS